jgi:hypothetical protein
MDATNRHDFFYEDSEIMVSRPRSFILDEPFSEIGQTGFLLAFDATNRNVRSWRFRISDFWGQFPAQIDHFYSENGPGTHPPKKMRFHSQQDFNRHTGLLGALSYRELKNKKTRPACPGPPQGRE